MRTRAAVLVGRDEEFQTIERGLAAARAGRGSALFLIGEAGIGKSRLAAAAADLAFAANMRLLRGRGSSIGPMVPYRPLTEALLSLLRSGDQADIRELGPYLPVLARLVPDLGPSSADEGGSLIILAEAVLRLTGLVGQGRGCLLVLDDLQDADPETLAMMDYLVGNLDRQPTMLIGAVRADPSPALDLARSAGQRGCASLLQLGRLGEQQVRQLAAYCLGDLTGVLPAEVTDQLWAGSAGIPLLVEEMLNEMLSSGLLVREDAGWRTISPQPAQVPGTLARAVAAQLDRLGTRGREILSVAAILGQRFPLAIVQAATGSSQRELLSQLYADVSGQLVAPDEQMPDWYAFQHPLIEDSLLTLLSQDERGRFARQAAAAVETVYPTLPGEWCQVSAALHEQAGDQARAGRLYAEAGTRALAQGAANSAVRLLDKALELLVHPEDARERAEALTGLLYALAEAGLVERAIMSADGLEDVTRLLSRGERARVHTRIAWAAVVAGRSRDGLAQVDIARALLGPDAPARDTAPVDVVAAHLILDIPGPDQVGKAEALARRAAVEAENERLPLVACQAWQLLGALVRSRAPDEATACLERARRIAVQHNLAIEEIHALIRLGNDDALRTGSITRLEQAQEAASRAGAVTSRYQAESSIALQAILRGDFAEARALIDEVLESATRLRLLETIQYTLLLRAVLHAHQGSRRDMDAALTDLRHWEGDHPQHLPRVHGLARAWCALLEEDRLKARRELELALAAEERSPSIFQLTGRYGMYLLLRALDGSLDRTRYEEIVAAPISRLRWDRQFALLAGAVLAGRAGCPGDAVAAVNKALEAGAPYPTGRHMGLRLVSEAAISDGWGHPVDWLRACEEYFHDRDVAVVAGACRALIRSTGAAVAQRRQGAADVPAALRSAGVTVREYEILQLLTERLSNREIASRLYLSPRTVEKHVASLMAKTSQQNRIALGEFAAGIARQAGAAAAGRPRGPDMPVLARIHRRARGLFHGHVYGPDQTWCLFPRRRPQPDECGRSSGLEAVA